MKTVMKTTAMGAVLASACMAGSVQAYESSADFRLDPIVGLSSGGSSAPGDVGQWLTPNAYNGSVTLQYSWADGSRAWNQDTFTAAGLPPAARNGDPFGPLHEQTMPALAADSPSAHALVEPGHMHADVTRPHPWDQSDASVGWDRTFSLLPNTAITFSGLATLGADHATTQEATFQASPNLNPQYANRGVLSFHSSLGDGRGWTNGISFIARIMNFDPRLPAGSPSLGRTGSVDDFAYSNDDQGHLSLTLFNHSNELMFTNLSLSVFAVAPVISPIPEPATWAAMLLGLGVLGWRRKTSGNDSAAVTASSAAAVGGAA